MPSHQHASNGKSEHRQVSVRHLSEEYRQQLENQAKAIAGDNEKMAMEILLLKKELSKIQHRVKAGLQQNRKATLVGQIIIMGLVAIVLTLMLK